MTILAVTMSQTSTLQERMAGNARDSDAAFQAAEAGLRAGEDALKNADAIVVCDDLKTCQATTKNYFSNIDLSSKSKSWWETNGIEYGVAGTQEISEVKEDPQYVAAVRGKYKESLRVGASSITYYEVTSHANGKTETAEAVTQGVYAKRTTH
jgi:type IV pilus assembly protein PilX